MKFSLFTILSAKAYELTSIIFFQTRRVVHLTVLIREKSMLDLENEMKKVLSDASQFNCQKIFQTVLFQSDLF